jgi:hypothetical protein
LSSEPPILLAGEAVAGMAIPRLATMASITVEANTFLILILYFLLKDKKVTTFDTDSYCDLRWIDLELHLLPCEKKTATVQQLSSLARPPGDGFAFSI